MAIRDFREMIDYTCSHSIMREIYGRNRDSMMLIKEMPYVLMKYLDDMSEIYINM